MASNASVAPVSTSALVRSSMKVGEVESTTCFAPILRKISACSRLRTMLTRATPSLRQILLSIWPRLEAAAVCTSALWPSRRIVSTIPSDVSGLTKQEAPSAAEAPSGSTRQSPALIVRYCEYMAPPIIATVLPISAFAASDDPVLITVPAPSLPTGIDSSSRPAIDRIAASGTLAVTIGASLVPDVLAVAMSAAPTNRPRSDGLIGDASTRTTTSSADGSGVGRLTNDISSSPLFLINERSCSPVLPSALITVLPFPITEFCGSVLALAAKRKLYGSDIIQKLRHSSGRLAGGSLSERLQCRLPRKFTLASQFLLDAQQLVVFGGTIRARQRAGLDLPAIGRDREVGDGGILGLARAVRHDGGIASLVGHFDRAQRFRQCADLIDLDQDRVGTAVLDAVGQPLHIGDKQVIAHQLAFGADQIGQFLPAFHVVFGHAVLDGDDGITRGEIGQIFRLFGARAGLFLAAIDVGAVLEELR